MKTWLTGAGVILLVSLSPLAFAQSVQEILTRRGMNLPPGCCQFQSQYQVRYPGRFGLPDLEYHAYVQRIENLPVAGSSVRMTLRRGEILSLDVQIYPHIQVSTQPKVSEQHSLQMARQALSRAAPAPSPKWQRDSIQQIRGKWRLIRTVAFRDSHEWAKVDLASGEVFVEDPRIFMDPLPTGGVIHGRGVFFDPLATGETLDLLPLGFLRLDFADLFGIYTGLAGDFSTILPQSPVAMRLSLRNGALVEVRNAQGLVLEAEEVVSEGDTVGMVLNDTQPDEFTTAQVNAFFHVNRVHQWLTERGITVEGFSEPLPAIVNAAGLCNAYYSFDAINFYRGGTSTSPLGARNCANAAMDTIIYHEYGHYVDDLFGGVRSLSLSEGGSDLLAVLVSGQPLIGENLFLQGTTTTDLHYMRTADNDYQYPPQGLGEAHAVGQAIAGFGWHLREIMLREMKDDGEAVALAEYLLLPVFIANPRDIPAAVREVFIRDDDNGNLEDGTPHFDWLMEAARRHNLQGALIDEPVIPPNLNPGDADSEPQSPTDRPGQSLGAQEVAGGGCSHLAQGEIFLSSLLPLAVVWIAGFWRRRFLRQN